MVAVLSTITLGAPFTTSQLMTNLTTAAVDCGFTTVDSSYSITSSTSGYNVTSYLNSSYSALGTTLKYQYNTSTKGTVYLNICCVANPNNSGGIGLAWSIFDTWNSSTHVGTNGSGYSIIQSGSGLSSNYPLTFWCINDTELRGFFIQQYGSTLNNTLVAVFRPSVQPSWWTNNNLDNTYLYAFIPYINNTGWTNPLSPSLYWNWVNYTGNAPWGVAPAQNSTTTPSFQIFGTGGICTFQNTNPNNSYIPDIQAGFNFLPPTTGNLAGIIGGCQNLWLVPGLYNSSSPGSSIDQGSIVSYTSGGTTYQGTLIAVPSPENTFSTACAIRTA